MKQNTCKRTALWALALLAIAVTPATVFAQAFTNDPYQAGSTWLLDQATSASGIITALAFAAGVIVIGFAMAGKLLIGWAARIIGGLIALSGLSWLIESIVSKSS